MLNKYEIYLKTQIGHLEMKTTMWEMKNILYGIYSKLDSAGEKISKLEAIAIQTIQNKTQRRNKN